MRRLLCDLEGTVEPVSHLDKERQRKSVQNHSHSEPWRVTDRHGRLQALYSALPSIKHQTHNAYHQRQLKFHYFVTFAPLSGRQDNPWP